MAPTTRTVSTPAARACALLLASLLARHVASTLHKRAGQSRSLNQVQGRSVPAEAPFPVQRKEGLALLALKKALKNHPVFNGFTPEQQQNIPALNGLPYGAWNMKDDLAGIPGYRRTPCSAAQWAWVGCDISRRVVSVNIEGPEIGKLNREWGAQGNKPITGYIPWGKLAVLEHLNDFNVAHQVIKGSLKGVGGLKALQNLSIWENKFSGKVPAEIAKLKKLLEFRADMNQFSGKLPKAMASMKRLAALAVSSNSLGGPFPPWIGSLAGLQWLDLSSNAFRGALPKGWAKLTKLTGIQLQFTSISGRVPSEWSGMRSLGAIGLLGTNLQSPIPDFIMKLPRVVYVRLSKNRLYGPLPKKFISPTMREVSLDDNYLNGTAGPIPANANIQLDLSLDTNCFARVTKDIVGYNPRPLSECKAFYKALNK